MPDIDETGNDPAQIFYNAATELISRGQFEQAIVELSKAYEIVIHYRTLERIGYCYEQLGKEHNAVLYYAAATTLNSNFIAPKRLIEMFLRMGDNNWACSIAKICLSRDPKHRFSLRIIKDFEENRTS